MPLLALRRHVSNPISGEVGAAAFPLTLTLTLSDEPFQTPSAGRWVLQPAAAKKEQWNMIIVSNPISGEVGAAALVQSALRRRPSKVSNPISGEVGAAARSQVTWQVIGMALFQTPSAGRWVLQPIVAPMVADLAEG